MSEPTSDQEPPLCLPGTNSNTSMIHSRDQPQSAVSDRTSASSDCSVKNYLKHHHYSLSGSSAFCSNESSPTTTCSLVDDSSVADSSPGTSPESPPPASYSMGLRPQSADDDKQSAFFDLPRVISPPRKGRNLKNLAVNTSRSAAQPSSLTSLPPGPQRQESAPSILSPAFVKPPEPQRRRPSNLGLTILTPSGTSSSPKQIRLAIPPTPGLAKPTALRHFQSSPSLPLLAGFHSGTDALINGKRLGGLDTIFSPLDPVRTSETPLHNDEQNYDVPLSCEEKPAAYPDGPICVYEPYVDLFLEPTAEEASRYDVVLNVASEVRNPFDSARDAAAAEPHIRIDGGGGIQYAPVRGPSAIQAPVEFNGSPTTPKATPLNNSFPDAKAMPRQGFEYIHIPWEHNSDIVPDLLRLCKLIDDRVEEHKRVLIHCQCGVSRSASLVVAYGLYKTPSMSVQEAYDEVKQKSKWIGPNMNLIMQLQEFRSSLARGGVLSSTRGLSPITPTSALSEWNGPFSAAANDVGPHADSLSAQFPSTSKSEHFESSVRSPLVPSIDAWNTTLPTGRARAISAVRASSAYVDPAGHVVPVVSIVEAPTTASSTVQKPMFIPLTPEPLKAVEPPLVSPRASEFAMTSLTPPRAADPADFFGIMSPTSTEFAANPFDRSALLAQLGMTTHTQQGTAMNHRTLKAKKSADEVSRPRTGISTPRQLRGKISSPTLRQQHQLQSMQARLEARLPRRQPPEAAFETDGALMSPRATEFTQNPFALALNSQGSLVGAATPAVDPRSPAQKGASPIVRSIDDFL